MWHSIDLSSVCQPSLARWTRRACGGLAATLCAMAQAVPVSVIVEGLPPGLTVIVNVDRNVCPDGMGWVSNPSQAMVERSHAVTEQVALPSGLTTVRTRVVTLYVASFDTPATPIQGAALWDRRCSTVGINEDLFRFAVNVKGLNALGGLDQMSGPIGNASQNAPVQLAAKLAARATGVNPVPSTLTRDVVHSLDVAYRSPLGVVQARRLDFLRPAADGSFTRVASIFLDSHGVPCIQAGATLRCMTAAPVEAGGVLMGRPKTLPGASGQIRFEFSFTHAFAPGPLRLHASADASDLARYFVDGVPQVLDLLPWQAMNQDVTVQ